MDIVDFIIELTASFGYIGVFFVVFLEYICFPIPSEVLLPFLGITIAKGKFSFVIVVILSTIAGIIGSLLCYFIGYIGGETFKNKLVKKFPKSQKTVIALNNWFYKYGKIAVFVARIIPLTRTYVSFIAGSERFSIKYFIAYSSIGILFWNNALIIIGYVVGDNLEKIEQILSNYTYVLVILLAIAIIIFLYMKIKKQKKDNL